MTDQKVQLKWTPGKEAPKKIKSVTLDGLGVQLQARKETLSAQQIWIFTYDGYIVWQSNPEYALTSLAKIAPDEKEAFGAYGLRLDEDDPYVAFVGVCHKCAVDSPFIYRQRYRGMSNISNDDLIFSTRWGIRQESGFTIGDWRYSKVENPLWHKMALTWPVDRHGAMIPVRIDTSLTLNDLDLTHFSLSCQDLQWPLEGSLIVGVPPIKSLKSSKGQPICTCR